MFGMRQNWSSFGFGASLLCLDSLRTCIANKCMLYIPTINQLEIVSVRITIKSKNIYLVKLLNKYACTLDWPRTAGFIIFKRQSIIVTMDQSVWSVETSIPSL